MSRRLLILISFLSCLLPTFVGAEILVLVHGYLSEGNIWRATGIAQTLDQAGWQDQGELFPDGIWAVKPSTSQTAGLLYTANLPSEAPLPVQAEGLAYYLYQLRKRHPDHDFVLIGHSSGGVIARLTLLTHSLPISAVITIASPHLGTDKAELGRWLSDSPAGWFAPLLGLSTLNRSHDLYLDLMREHPSTPLFWMNRQPHPPIFYASIVRAAGDRWVPPYSQDLNDVPALRGKALTLVTAADHSLHPADAVSLLSLLNQRPLPVDPQF